MANQLLHTSQPVSFCTSHHKTSYTSALETEGKTPSFHGAVADLHLTHGYVLQRNLLLGDSDKRANWEFVVECVTQS